MVPTFYDSIEVSRDRMIAKFHRRCERRNVVVAFGMTLVEAVLALLGLRLLWRGVIRLGRRIAGRAAPAPAG